MVVPFLLCLEGEAQHGVCSPIYEKGKVGAQPQQAETSYSGRRSGHVVAPKEREQGRAHGQCHRLELARGTLEQATAILAAGSTKLY